MSGESVKVAVRVRPFNQREKDRGAKLIIGMNGKQTTIKNPDSKEGPKNFAFDFSYWSHDEFEADEEGILQPTGSNKYSSQRLVFNDLGQGVLNNAFEGYNTSLFAYGQTGSGKSYSMVGYGPNKGIVPITCDEMFKTIQGNQEQNKRFEVTFSMLEIYNEQVRDLLNKDNPKGGLQVRQNPKIGFYVQDLKKVPVGSYKEIERRMEQGTASRTVASTQMNATSSRAHTVVTITFDQIIKGDSGETKKSSVMNLVDLAGSERADSTGATGDRLKEGANINKSLSALGNVISALADQSSGNKKVLVPYRDSVLTKLLQNALGGNSKTIMIAALSPADINYDETLSTLRYADRAKKIKNKAVVNENPVDRLIRELKEENEKLKQMMTGGGQMPLEGSQAMSQEGLSAEEIDKMRKEMEEEIRAQLMANQEMLAGAEGEGPSWEEKLAAANTESMTEAAVPDRKNKEAHLTNLNEDPLLAGVVFHYFKDGETTIGRKDADVKPDVILSGLSIMKNHAVITKNKAEYELRPGMPGAKTKVNGAPLTGPLTLTHKDRVLFGSNHMYVFCNPTKKDSSADLPDTIDWEFAQKEIAQAKGFDTGAAGLTKDQQIAQEQVLEILPMVSEVNAVSEELDKHRTFEVVLVSAAAQEGALGTQKGTKVMVKMKNLLNGNTWLWERGKFMNRRFLVQDLYQRWLDGDEDVQKIKKEEDPFWEPTEDVLIGNANVFLQSLAYGLDFDDRLAITDYKGQEEGSISVHVAPCTQTGKPLDEDYFVDNPSELLGKPYHFKVSIRSAEIKKARFSKGIQIKYRVYTNEKITETKMIKGNLSPKFNHSEIFTFSSVTEDHLLFFDNQCITFSVYGVQEDSVADPKLNKMSTKELRQMEHFQTPSTNRRGTVFSLDSSETGQLKSELMLLQKKFDRLEQKEKRMQEICREWEKKAEAEKDFDGLLRSVSAVANSSGTKLRTRVQVLNRVLLGYRLMKKPGESSGDSNPGKDDDTISVYVFGDEEDSMQKVATQNGGVLSHDLIKRHYGDKGCRSLLQQKNAVAAKQSGAGQKKSVSQNGVPNEGSKACVII
ncbi:hypothetical protein CAPTEDRAFT_223727 [Capitella teleta]|uniref:Kinesin-like protein 6 n=1 Tax=Capitella teleta TaxID=283909 RepID=R7U173_CAPTE|nr:hypothetical protein CAPTEDRAFT_223727 [Capitella teleta]|eukprot:ELT99958.1 hypothetical protein CAPTEDRAFT_223727 [Capitella teleta]